MCTQYETCNGTKNAQNQQLDVLTDYIYQKNVPGKCHTYKQGKTATQSENKYHPKIQELTQNSDPKIRESETLGFPST